MCFFRLALQSFLERKSREAACFPSHGDWLNAVTRHGGVEHVVGKCTRTTPPPWLKCVTSSLFGHNLLQCASSQLPVCRHNVLPLRLTRGHGRAKDSMFYMVLDHVCLLKMVSFMKSFPHWFVRLVWHSCTQYGPTDDGNKGGTRERAEDNKETKKHTTWLQSDCNIQCESWLDCGWQRKD